MSPSRKLRVYIVDDSRTQSEVARALLEKEGHAVLVNHSSEEALRDIPARRPDCVLLDIMMPGLDGYELCRRLRAMSLYLFHHDPDQSDAVVDAKLAQAREVLGKRGAATEVRAPLEYAEVEV